MAIPARVIAVKGLTMQRINVQEGMKRMDSEHAGLNNGRACAVSEARCGLNYQIYIINVYI
jgi:hypothetical protein